MTVFADATYYVALLSPRDQHHRDAVRISATLRERIVVSEFVLIEVTNALSTLASRGRAISLWDHLQHDPTVTVVPASTVLLARGLQLYSQRIDKEWSLTDCISFIIMDELGIAQALTADRHFEQAGYAALLSS